MSMLSNWLTQLISRNPQLLREIKGRMQRRNVLVTVAASLLIQLLIVGHHWRRIDSAYGETSLNDFLRHGWWFDLFSTTTWVALLLLLFLGSYLVVKDIAKEERRGTLDFVRLTPESGQSVLLGKLLGVPVLLHLAIALAIPLHLYAAIRAGLPLLAIVGVYLLAAVSCGFVYNFALLHSLGWGAKAQAWYVLPVPGIIYFLLYMLGLYGNHQYQQIKVQTMAVSDAVNGGDAFFLVISFLLTALAVLTLGFWCESVKRFHRPPLRR